MTDRPRSTPNCRTCANRQSVSGACGHANRQALVSQLAGSAEPSCPCYSPDEEP